MKKFVTIFLSLNFASISSAGDWPQWRGPDRTDINAATGLLKSWPGKGPEQLWVNKTSGLGYGGLAIVEGIMYTVGAENDNELLLMIDARSGKELKRVKIGPLFENKWGNGPRSTPTIDGDRVYVMSSQGHLNSVDRKTGQIFWKVEMKSFGGAIPNWGYTESPLVDGNNVVVTPGGSKGAMLALNKMTGKKVWQSADWKDGAQYSSIIAADHGGKRHYIQLVQKNVVGIDASNGDLLWKHEWDGKVAVIPTPIYKDGKVYISSGYGIGCMQVDIRSGKAEKVFKNKNMKNHHGGVILLDEHLFGYSDGHGWVCQSWTDGEIVWREKGSLGKGAIAYADGHFYLQDEKSGDIVLIEASTKGWNEKGRFTLSPQTKLRKPDGRIWVHPVIWDGKLYLRDQELIHCYDIKG